MNQFLRFSFLLLSCLSLHAQCLVPENIQVYNPGMYSASLEWYPEWPVDATGYEIYLTMSGQPGPGPDTLGTPLSGNGYTFTNLNCNTWYVAWLRSFCGSSMTLSEWVPKNFNTLDCLEMGSVPNWEKCPINGEACFDLHENDAQVLGNNDPGQYAVHYLSSPDNIPALTDEITSEVCISSGYRIIYAMLQDNATQAFDVNSFSVYIPDGGCAGIKLQAYLDSNGNGTREVFEPDFSYAQFQYQRNADGEIHYANTAHLYTITESFVSNSYDINFNIDPEFAAYFAAPATTSFTNVQAPAEGFVTLDFPVTALAPYHDLGISLSSYVRPRAGFVYNITLTYTNNGNLPASGLLSFTKPPGTTLLSAVPYAGGLVAMNASGYTYNFSNLGALESNKIVMLLQLPPIPAVSIGELLTTVATIEADNDGLQANNVMELTEAVSGSFDPNDKMEAHGPEIHLDSFSATDDLTYTIRFENTGNADAIDIKVTDTLDAQLDASTVRMVDSSHNLVMERLGQALTFRFTGINLPPSVPSDAWLGHGYLTFKVKPLPGIAAGDVIPNTAAIFFDFNPPITTNTFETHFTETLGHETKTASAFVLHPNPATEWLTVESSQQIDGIKIYDVSGKLVLATDAASSSKTFPLAGLAPGLYLVKVFGGEGNSVQKLIVR